MAFVEAEASHEGSSWWLSEYEQQKEQAEKLKKHIQKKHEGQSWIRWTVLGEYQQDLEDFKVENDGGREIGGWARQI